MTDGPVSIAVQNDGFRKSIGADRKRRRHLLRAFCESLLLLAASGLVPTLNSAVLASGSAEQPAAVSSVRAYAPSEMVHHDHSGAGNCSPTLSFVAESRLPNAISSSSTAVNENTNGPERLFARIAAELSLNHIKRAREWVIQANEVFPRDPALAYQTGKALLEHNLPDDAEAEFDRAAGLLTGDKSAASNVTASDVQLQLARIHYDRHDYWRALDDLRKVRMQMCLHSLDRPHGTSRASPLLAWEMPPKLSGPFSRQRN